MKPTAPGREAALLDMAYLPNIQYLGKFLLYDTIVFCQGERYSKQTFRNRARLAAANGPLELVVPVRAGRGLRLPMAEALVDNSLPWWRNHWQSIVSAYRSSPFFEHFEDELRQILWARHERLIELDLALLQFLLRAFGIRKQPLFLDCPAHELPNWADCRPLFSPKEARQAPDPDFRQRPYAQVFAPRHGFLPGLSALDLLCNEGPDARDVLAQCLVP